MATEPQHGSEQGPGEQRPPESRRQQVRRILQECDWGRLEDIDDWEGEDLESLRETLGEQQFQALLDKLVEEGHQR